MCCDLYCIWSRDTCQLFPSIAICISNGDLSCPHLLAPPLSALPPAASGHRDECHCFHMLPPPLTRLISRTLVNCNPHQRLSSTTSFSPALSLSTRRQHLLEQALKQLSLRSCQRPALHFCYSTTCHQHPRHLQQRQERITVSKMYSWDNLPKPNVIFVLGGPGAGKGTQCSLICKVSLTSPPFSSSPLLTSTITALSGVRLCPLVGW